MLRVLATGYHATGKTTLFDELKKSEYGDRIYLKEDIIYDLAIKLAIRGGNIGDSSDFDSLDEKVRNGLLKKIEGYILDREKSQNGNQIIVSKKSFYKNQDGEIFGLPKEEDYEFADIVVGIKVPGAMLIPNIRKTGNRINSILNEKQLDKFMTEQIQQITSSTIQRGKIFITVGNANTQMAAKNIISIIEEIISSKK